MKWWQTAVFYQIYPRSFCDGNGDGIGDFKGMISKLDYLKELGIGAVWLSPHYPSPNVDCGYDVSDYCDVAPEYGTLEDFDRFLEGCHQRGMRVVLDLVLNHTSDQHAWFIESRSSKDNPKRDWYVWKQGKDGKAPNNWDSTFGGSAWEWDETTQEYYYHYFFKEQPDLNWHNPQVRRAMWDAVRFWLDRGVDGFRLDAVGTIFENEDWADQDSGLDQDELYRRSRRVRTPEDFMGVMADFDSIFHNQYDQPGVHELMKELRKVVDEYDDRVLVGETDSISFYGNGNDELHLVFNFPIMRLEHLTPQNVQQNQQERLAELPAGSWPCNTLGNHDSPRMLNRYGDGVYDAEIARVNLAVLLGLKGTPVLYNGEEIGMSDYLFTDPRLFRDSLAFRYFELDKRVMDSTAEQAAVVGAKEGRDKCRTPHQWSNEPNAGFCPSSITPWLPVNPDYTKGINVADQEVDPSSMLGYYRRILYARNNSKALQEGEYQPLETTHNTVLAFRRTSGEQQVFCLQNMTGEAGLIELDQTFNGKVLFSNCDRQGEIVLTGKVTLLPYEVLWVTC
jgi:alpha-glucosidase